MLEELSIVRLASALARHSTARHRVVAQNVANADTPAYRARDIRPFADYVNETLTVRTSASGPGSGFQPRVIDDPEAQMSPNGNSVSLEGEMVKAVEAQGRHALAQIVYRKVHDFMRLGIGRI